MSRQTRVCRTPLSLALIGVLTLSLASCEDGGDGAAEGTAEVSVTLGDFFVKVAPPAAPEGEARFNVTNTSGTAHEFYVPRTNAPEGRLPVSEDNKADESGKVGELHEFEGPAATRKLALALEPGAYVLICNVPGHHLQGMHASFTVEPLQQERGRASSP